jgi:hypothetical protein
MSRPPSPLFFLFPTSEIDIPDSCADLLIWAAAEGSVTIIATSIPFLRLALKEVSKRTFHGTRESYYLHSKENAASRRDTHLRTGRGTARVVEGLSLSRHGGRADHPFVKADDHSDKSILGAGRATDRRTIVTATAVDGRLMPGDGTASGGIVQMNEFTVEITDAESSKDKDFVAKDLMSLV